MNLLSSPFGKMSSNRTIAIWAWFIFGICWSWASYKTGTVAEIPESVLFLLGIASGSSVGNAYLNEKPLPDKETATTATLPFIPEQQTLAATGSMRIAAVVMQRAVVGQRSVCR